MWFNEDIGANADDSELGRLVIEQADGGVIFGQGETDDDATPDPVADTGPVELIELRGDGTAANALDVGSLSIRIEGIDERTAFIDEGIERMEARLVSFEERLRNQFTAMEQMISGLQSQASFLSNFNFGTGGGGGE